MTHDLNFDEIRRYSRHLLMPEVGLLGQAKLKAASVLVVGVGGLGSPAAQYLAAAGVGRLGLVDYDVVSESNLQRQVLYGQATLGERKVLAAQRRLQDLNPGIEILAYDEPFTSANALRIASGYDLVLDGTDNFPTRYLTNDLCVKLGIPNIYGSIFRFEGQVSVFDAQAGPCYRCLFPSPPPPGSVPSCAEGGVLGVLPGVVGSLQATEALKVILGIGESVAGWLLLYNALDGGFDRIRLKKNPDCVVCSKPIEEIQLIDYEEFCGVPAFEPEYGSAGADMDMTVKQLAAELAAGGLTVVDVREAHELEIAAIQGARHIPLGELAGQMAQLDMHGRYALLCRSGSRSARAVELLRAAGFRDVHNVAGGINAWTKEIDPSQPLY